MRSANKGLKNKTSTSELLYAAVRKGDINRKRREADDQISHTARHAARSSSPITSVPTVTPKSAEGACYADLSSDQYDQKSRNADGQMEEGSQGRCDGRPVRCSGAITYRISSQSATYVRLARFSGGYSRYYIYA